MRKGYLMKRKIITKYSILGLALLILVIQPRGTFGELIETDATQEIEATEEIAPAIMQALVEEPAQISAQASTDNVISEPQDTVEAPIEETVPEQTTPEQPIETEEVDNVPEVNDLQEEQPSGAIPEQPAIDAPVADNVANSEETMEEPAVARDEEVLDEETAIVLETIVEEKEDLSSSTIWKGQNVSQKDLKNAYQLTFSDDFASVMGLIEAEYRLEYALAENTEQTIHHLSAMNWQDIIARYLLEKKSLGETTFSLDMEDKEGLQKLYREMNRVIYVEDTKESTHETDAQVEQTEAVTQTQPIETRIFYRNLLQISQLAELEGTFQYQNLTVEDVLALDQILLEPVYTEEEIKFLQKYTSEEFRILCAGATRAGEFLQQPEYEVSRGRQEVLKAAFQAIGRVPYFWGGKSAAIGLDSRIGSPTVVSAGGSTTTGQTRAYGLDCSGFVSWAFINGAYHSGTQISGVGAGTVGQWALSVGITQEEALPGDLVFLASPEHVRGINHVGIVVGKDSEGGLIAIHCNAGDNGVVVESAHAAGFRYVRRPIAFSNEITR